MSQKRKWKRRRQRLMWKDRKVGKTEYIRGNHKFTAIGDLLWRKEERVRNYLLFMTSLMSMKTRLNVNRRDWRR